MMSSSAHGLWRLSGRLAVSVMRVGLFLLLLDFVLFALFDLLPDAAIQRLGVMAIDEELLNATRERLGVSGPWYERFLQFWWHLLHGDLGHSLQGDYPIASSIVNHLGVTTGLLIASVAILVTVPVPIASLFAKPGQRELGGTQRLLLLPVYLGLIPQFLLAVALFAVWAGLLADPFHEMGAAGVMRWSFAVVSVVAMPFAIALFGAVQTFQIACCEQFTLTYLMLGLSRSRIRWLLMRNAWQSLRPLTARLALTCATGVIFTEYLFGLPGVGRLLIESLRTSDLNMMRVLVLGLGCVVLTATEWERRPA